MLGRDGLYALLLVVTVAFAALLVGLGLIGGGLSGLLGIGGGLVIIPLLLYVPGALGFEVVDIRAASAIAVVQVTAATLSGAIAHGRSGRVYARLAVTMSVGSATGALLGGVVSAYIPADTLLVATATLATTAAALMFIPRPPETIDPTSYPPFRPALAVLAGFLIGLVIGMNGAGAFLMVPVLIFVFRMPTRVALATVLAVGFPTSAAAAFGKMVTGQVALWASLAVVVGAIPGAQLGSLVSARTPARVLRWLYGALVSVIAIGMWWDVLHSP